MIGTIGSRLVRLLIVSCLLGVVVAACSDVPLLHVAEELPVARIEGDVGRLDMTEGDTLSIRVRLFDAVGRELERPEGRFFWHTEDAQVATVSRNNTAGRIRAVGSGSTTVTVRVDEVTLSLPITVTGRPTRFVFHPGRLYVLPGLAERVQVEVLDRRDTVVPIAPIFTSSDQTIATVTAAGVVTGVGVGHTLISVIAGSLTSSFRVDVLPDFGRAVRAVYTGGSSHNCYLLVSGEAVCSGSNFSGQLGNGTTQRSDQGVEVVTDQRFASLSLGGSQTCGLTFDGRLFCWGQNSQGQLGIGSNTLATVPSPVEGGYRFTSVMMGDSHTCALDRAGVAWCWGTNFSGRLGTGSQAPSSNVPVQVVTDQRFVSLVGHSLGTCGSTGAGALWCWGGDQLPQVVQLTRFTPVDMSAPVALTGLVTNGFAFCGLDVSRRIWCARRGVPWVQLDLLPVDRLVGPGGNTLCWEAGDTVACGSWGTSVNQRALVSNRRAPRDQVAGTAYVSDVQLSRLWGVASGGRVFRWALNNSDPPELIRIP